MEVLDFIKTSQCILLLNFTNICFGNKYIPQKIG